MQEDGTGFRAAGGWGGAPFLHPQKQDGTFTEEVSSWTPVGHAQHREFS